MCLSIQRRSGYDATVSTRARNAGPTSELAPRRPAITTMAAAKLTSTVSARGIARVPSGDAGGTAGGVDGTVAPCMAGPGARYRVHGPVDAWRRGSPVSGDAGEVVGLLACEADGGVLTGVRARRPDRCRRVPRG